MVREIIKLLDGMKYKDAVAILDCCKNSLELTMVRASEIIMNDENDLAQSHLDEKARQEGDGE